MPTEPTKKTSTDPHGLGSTILSTETAENTPNGIVHDEFECEVCGLRFNFKNALLQHKFQVHKIGMGVPI